MGPVGVNKNPVFCRCSTSFIHILVHRVNREVWDEVSFAGVGFEVPQQIGVRPTEAWADGRTQSFPGL